jgi:hypothetical protein
MTKSWGSPLNILHYIHKQGVGFGTQMRRRILSIFSREWEIEKVFMYGDANDI